MRKPRTGALNRDTLEQLALPPAPDVAKPTPRLSVASAPPLIVPYAVSAPAPRQGVARRAAPSANRCTRATAHAPLVAGRSRVPDQATRPPRDTERPIAGLPVPRVVRAARVAGPRLRPHAPDALAAARPPS